MLHHWRVKNGTYGMRYAAAFYADDNSRVRMDTARDMRATRRWFAERKGGWSPAERIRRSPFYACEWWACSGLEYLRRIG